MMPQQPADGQAQTPVLVARIGREQRVFPVGMQIRVRRDRSRRGTFLDGKRLCGPLRITEPPGGEIPSTIFNQDTIV